LQCFDVSKTDKTGKFGRAPLLRKPGTETSRRSNL
jgi:hypothetical protein